MSREAAAGSAILIDQIARWLEANPRWARQIVLVGGWAVHALAPYYFSVDIDLIVRKDARDALKREFTGWHLYPENPAAGAPKKRWIRETSGSRPVVLEIFGVGTSNSFERDRKASIAWSEALANSEVRTIPWDDPLLRPNLPTCNPGLLLLYKLKAFDDRGLRILGEGDESGYLQDKRVKDAKDVWALLKVMQRRPDLAIIRKYTARYPFLLEILPTVADVRGVADPPHQGTAGDLASLVDEFVSVL